MRQSWRGSGAHLGLAMALRGSGLGLLCGVASAAVAGAALVLADHFSGRPHPPRSLLDLLGFCALVALFAIPWGAVVGFGLGAVGGGLLGWLTSMNPRSADARAEYRRRAVPVVGVLMGAAVAIAMLAFILGGAQQPAFVQRGALDRAKDFLPALFVAVEAGIAAGWSTCRLLGWYAAQPE